MRAISNNIRYIIVVVMAAILLLGLRSSVWAATLSLTPNTASAVVSGVFSVEILLDAQGATIDGADIVYLHYDPSLLEIQDDDASASGIQIAAGTLMPNTVTNSVDAATGRIAFSQVTNTNESFTGSGTLAAVRFKALAAGTANVTFDSTSGSTADTNVASDGADILTAVTDGAYALVPDSIPPSTPNGLSAVAIDSSQISLGWATSTDNVTVVGYQILRNGVSIATSTITEITDSNLTPATSHVYTVAAYDAAGNVSLPSIAVTATTSPLFVKGVSFLSSLEVASAALSREFTFILFASGTTTPSIQFTGNLDAEGKILIPDTFSVLKGDYDLSVSSPGHLRRKINSIAFTDNIQILIPALFAGDVNGDNTVNSIDWSLMRAQWLTNDIAADLNSDGIINSVDFSLLNKNWLYAGDI